MVWASNAGIAPKLFNTVGTSETLLVKLQVFVITIKNSQDSVLSVRLAAFASLGVVAGLMVQNSFDAWWPCKGAIFLIEILEDGYLGSLF